MLTCHDPECFCPTCRDLDLVSGHNPEACACGRCRALRVDPAVSVLLTAPLTPSDPDLDDVPCFPSTAAILRQLDDVARALDADRRLAGRFDDLAAEDIAHDDACLCRDCRDPSAHTDVVTHPHRDLRSCPLCTTLRCEAAVETLWAELFDDEGALIPSAGAYREHLRYAMVQMLVGVWRLEGKITSGDALDMTQLARALIENPWNPS